MRVDYQIRIYTQGGVLKAVIGDEFNFTMTNAVNQVGALDLSLPYGSPYVALRNQKDIFEIRRRVVDLDAAGREVEVIPWYTEGTFIYRDPEMRDDSAIQTFVGHCTSLEEILSWRIVAFPAGLTNKTKWLAAKTETIMKDLVKWNLTTNATAGNGRYLNGDIAYSLYNASPAISMSIQADAAGGTTRDWFCEHRNLLQTLQDLAEGGGGDFAVVRTSATNYEFRFYAGQLGADRTATVVFSLDRANMADPVYRVSRIGHPTAAIVGGDGPNDARVVVNVLGADSSANQVEEFVDARGFTTAQSLTDYGTSHLNRKLAEKRLAFTVIQTPGCLFGREYFLGDKVTGVAFGISASYKVASRTVRFAANGAEILTIGLNNA